MWEKACFTATEPLVTVAGDNSVEEISHRSRNEPGYEGNPPEAAKSTRDLEGCFAPRVDAIVAQHDKGVRVVGIQTEVVVHAPPEVGLDRREPEHALVISCQDEPDREGAKAADPVEEDDRMRGERVRLVVRRGRFHNVRLV
jgi:hypothetical protein